MMNKFKLLSVNTKVTKLGLQNLNVIKEEFEFVQSGCRSAHNHSKHKDHDIDSPVIDYHLKMEKLNLDKKE